MAVFQTAFQNNAFQSNAFQIFGEQGGASGKGGRRPYSEPEKQLYEQHKDALDDVTGNRRLLSLVDQGRRSTTQSIIDVLPETERIDFTAITQDILASKRLLEALQAEKRQQDDEAALATMLLFLWP